MKSSSFIFASLLVSLSLGACANESEPNVPPTDENPPRINQTLIVNGDCDFVTCGSVPSSFSTEAKVTCGGSTEKTCSWTGNGDNSTVSYRYCSDAECPPKLEVTCPSGTTLTTQACGSQNDGPCAWTTTCTPPRETTPCPETTGCDALPMMAIGIVCADGTMGGMTCVTDGQNCYWGRDCD